MKIKKAFKKVLSLFLAVLIFQSISTTAFAVEKPVIAEEPLPTLEDFQKMFPNLDLDESGYLGNASASVVSAPQTAIPLALSNTNAAVATYSAEDAEGNLYYVSVYPDNSYLTYGLTTGTTGISAGSTSSDSTYTYHTNRRVYVLLYASVYNVNYYVSYKTNKSTNLSTFTNIGIAACTAITTNIDGTSNGASGQSIPSVYVRQSETSSAKASAYGGGKMYYGGIYTFTLKLYVDIRKGTASVRVVEA